MARRRRGYRTRNYGGNPFKKQKRRNRSLNRRRNSRGGVRM